MLYIVTEFAKNGEMFGKPGLLLMAAEATVPTWEHPLAHTGPHTLWACTPPLLHPNWCQGCIQDLELGFAALQIT